MQRPSERKRRQILNAAASLFSTRPFHEVYLDDVAARAKVGKGTLYVYFKSKEDLYVSLIRQGFADMAAQARDGIEGSSSRDVWARLRIIIHELIRFGTRYPDLYRVMRNRTLTPDDKFIQSTRGEVVELIEDVLRDGVRARLIADPHPGITAQFVLGFVRSALLYPPKGMTPAVLEKHILHVLRSGLGLAATGASPRKGGAR